MDVEDTMDKKFLCNKLFTKAIQAAQVDRGPPETSVTVHKPITRKTSGSKNYQDKLAPPASENQRKKNENAQLPESTASSSSINLPGGTSQTSHRQSSNNSAYKSIDFKVNTDQSGKSKYNSFCEVDDEKLSPSIQKPRKSKEFGSFNSYTLKANAGQKDLRMKRGNASPTAEYKDVNRSNINNVRSEIREIRSDYDHTATGTQARNSNKDRRKSDQRDYKNEDPKSAHLSGKARKSDIVTSIRSHRLERTDKVDTVAANVGSTNLNVGSSEQYTNRAKQKSPKIKRSDNRDAGGTKDNKSPRKSHGSADKIYRHSRDDHSLCTESRPVRRSFHTSRDSLKKQLNRSSSEEHRSPSRTMESDSDEWNADALVLSDGKASVDEKHQSCRDVAQQELFHGITVRPSRGRANIRGRGNHIGQHKSRNSPKAWSLLTNSSLQEKQANDSTQQAVEPSTSQPSSETRVHEVTPDNSNRQKSSLSFISSPVNTGTYLQMPSDKWKNDVVSSRGESQQKICTGTPKSSSNAPTPNDLSKSKSSVFSGLTIKQQQIYNRAQAIRRVQSDEHKKQKEAEKAPDSAPQSRNKPDLFSEPRAIPTLTRGSTPNVKKSRFEDIEPTFHMQTTPLFNPPRSPSKRANEAKYNVFQAVSPPAASNILVPPQKFPGYGHRGSFGSPLNASVVSVNSVDETGSSLESGSPSFAQRQQAANAAAEARRTEEQLNNFRQNYCHFATPYADSHCHLDLLLWERHRWNSSFTKFKNEKVSTSVPPNFAGCIAVFAHPRYHERVGKIRELLHEDGVFGAMGCHPKCAAHGAWNESLEAKIRQFFAWEPSRLVAVGECGLDYSQDKFSSPAAVEAQKASFEAQMKMAKELQLPLVIHCRDASDDCFQMMQETLPHDFPVHRHCFTGDSEDIKKWHYAFPNMFFGFTPIIQTNKTIQLSSQEIPLDKILLETDAPYFLPHGTKALPGINDASHPALSIAVARQISLLRNRHINEILDATYKNTVKLYRANFQVFKGINSNNNY